MLPSTHRLRRSADFGAAVRGGGRAGGRALVVHVAREARPGETALVGFVVSKAVGGAVVRNRTKRRLRALARPLVESLPEGSRVVVRANPGAATASTGTLAKDLLTAWGRLGLTAGGTVQAPPVPAGRAAPSRATPSGGAAPRSDGGSLRPSGRSSGGSAGTSTSGEPR